MQRIIVKTSFLFNLFLAAFSGVEADTTSVDTSMDQTKVVKLKINQKIGPSAFRKTKSAFELVNKENADYLLLHLNTYGGRVSEADSIKTRLLKSPVPVYTFIDPNAASAGALISIATNKIYMSPSATMGAATVVNKKGKKMPEKYQSYMRGTMRATAEARDRDPDIAEAMVDESIKLEGISPKGELVTFTRQEAIEHGYCDGKATSVKEVLKQEELNEAQVIKTQTSWIDLIINFLINPAVSSVLILGIFGGLYFELQSPGLGFPLGIAVVSAILYFTPLYLEALAANWEIAVFILGVILIAVELFVIPGLGIAGISGLILMVFSLVLTLIQNDFFDFTFTRSDEVLKALLTVASSIILLIIGIFTFGKSMLNSHLFQRLVLQDTLADPNQSDSKELNDENQQQSGTQHNQSSNKIGTTAEAYTQLAPSGKVMIGDEIYEGVSEGAFIEKGQQVRVVKESGNRLVVRANQ